MSKAQLLQALDMLRTGGLRPGSEMDAAHEICQAHEGVPSYDWVHALVHRIEGDDANAGYWYRRAGKTRHAGTVAEEWGILRAEIEAS